MDFDKNDTTKMLEDEPLRSESISKATGEEQRIFKSTDGANEVEGRKPEGWPPADVHDRKQKIRCCQTQYTMGTWNIRTMNQGKLEVIKKEMRRLNIDIMGISELKWKGTGQFTSDDFQVFYSGHENIRRNGVAFIVGRRMAGSVMGFSAVNDRMASIRIKGAPLNLTVIQVYAPTSGAEEKDVDSFYEQLQKLIDSVPKKDVMYVMGDWNAKIGCKQIPGVVGKFGLGDCNEAGDRMIEFCQNNSLTVANTLFKQPVRRRYTWTSPNGQHRNQIDFILCQQRWRSSIQSAKTRPGADCGSDHELVIAKFRIRLKKGVHCKRQAKHDVHNIPYEYTVEVSNRFQALNLENRPPDDLWMELKEIVTTAATKHVPKISKTKRKAWLSEEAIKIAEERKKAKGGADRTQYAQLNAKFQQIARRDKNAFLETQCKELEEDNKKGRTRELFKKIKNLTGEWHPRIGAIKDESGKVLTEAEEINRRWADYTEGLYKKTLNTHDETESKVTDLEPEILESEVRKAMESIANNKAPGCDDIPIELLKNVEDDAIKVVHAICKQMWNTLQWPRDWKRSLYIPIPKKGNSLECSNHRTIALIPHASKIMLKVVQARMKQYIDRELPEEQAGFRKGRGTRDQIASIRWIIEKSREYQKSLYMCFIDYSKAFDCVDHNKLWQILKEMGLPKHLICLLRNLYNGQEAAVRTRHGTSRWFTLGRGVRQGCILSPDLFNIYAEYIMRKAEIDEMGFGVRIAGRIINNLRYADDTTLLAESESDMRQMLKRVKEESAKAGLQLNIKKTKMMAPGKKENWVVDGQEMEMVTDIIYLGANINCNGEDELDIKRRIQLGKSAMTRLGKIWKSRDIKKETKAYIVRTMVFPIMMYGSESWTLRKKDRRRIDAFEMWCWRKMLRISWTAKRTNLEVIAEIKPKHTLEALILKQKLEFLGHIMRRYDSLGKSVMLATVEGKRKRGRPKTRWLDNIMEAMNMNIEELRSAVEDRTKWRIKVHSVTQSRKRLND